MLVCFSRDVREMHCSKRKSLTIIEWLLHSLEKKICENLHILYTIFKIVKYWSLIWILAYSIPVPDKKCHILEFGNSSKSYLEAKEFERTDFKFNQSPSWFYAN